MTKSKKPDKQDTAEPKMSDKDRAYIACSPVVGSASTIDRFLDGAVGKLDVRLMFEEVEARAKAIQANDLSSVEVTLSAQAATLDAIFNALARRAAQNMGQYINAMDVYLRLALKAQAQCRATLETLAEVKNPRHVAFVKQANIAHGPQRVNNGGGDRCISPAHARTRAEDSTESANGLLEQKNGQRVDARTTGTASGDDQELAPVGALDRPTD